MADQKKIMVCCFGELLLRFSPVMQGKFIEDANMPVFIGGAELNAATALANWNIPVKYMTALPDNYLAREIADNVHDKKINVDSIKYCGERIGSYFLPQGSDLKNNAVIYDRNYSSFSALKPGDINWKEVLKDASWFHFSAISAALNDDAAAVCLEGAKAATAMGISVSIDLNYRAKLWQYGKQPIEVMPDLVEYCDVVMGNIWSDDKLLGTGLSEGFDPFSGDKALYIEEATISAANLMKKFPKCKTVANTFRFDKGESGITYFATLHQYGLNFTSATYETDTITDKIGSGDCFMAGLIYGLSQQHEPQAVIDFATAAAFTKLHQRGDASTSSVAEVQKNIRQNG